MSYPDKRVARFITEYFIPVKVNVLEAPELAKSFHVMGAPVILTLDGDSIEHYRFEGFLPPKEFLSRLNLSLAMAHLNRGDYGETANKLEGLLTSEKELLVDVAAEAWYTLGKARMKATGDREAAWPSWEKLVGKYPDTTWARRVAYLFE